MQTYPSYPLSTHHSPTNKPINLFKTDICGARLRGVPKFHLSYQWNGKYSINDKQQKNQVTGRELVFGSIRYYVKISLDIRRL